MHELKGKVAVITGAAEGIGKAIARQAATEGMKLALADIDGPRLEATVSGFLEEGVDVLGVRTDVSKSAEVEALADAVFARFGNVHVLVNNAGVALAKTAWEATLSDWEWVLGVNLYGVIHGVRAFLPTMLAKGQAGHIVNVASAAGLISVPSFATYNVSKHGVVTLSEGLFQDLALRSSQIKVSVLCPAWVKTRLIDSQRNRALGEQSGSPAVDKVTSRLAGSVLKAVDQGMEPGRVATAVFEAIRAERFYILTHPNTKAGVKIRMDDILLDRNPTLLPLDS